jgi:hypothetical protein
VNYRNKTRHRNPLSSKCLRIPVKWATHSGDSGPHRSEATADTHGGGEMDLSSDGRTCRRNTSIIISFLGFPGSILAPWSGVPFSTKAALPFAGNMAHGSGPLPAESWPNRTGIRNPDDERGR